MELPSTQDSRGRRDEISRRAALKAGLAAAGAVALPAGWAAGQLQSGKKAGAAEMAPGDPLREVRGTWVTTTGNDAIATPANTAETMRRLRAIGLNTVYVEVWKNGYTQFPSDVLKRTVGVDRRPALMKQDPGDEPGKSREPGRDLLLETLTEAHRNGLTYIAWFEYGFMAAHKDTDNHLRRMKKEWLSKDIKGNEVAPNGFVWMNPLHPEARRFLLDLVLEAIDKYDLDGIQIDDRIVWPYITMGYDDFTRGEYAKEHGGKQPPEDHTNEEWRRWRADKVNEFSKQFVQELRAARPGILISLSPAVYPWCYEHYCLEWPKWAAWTSADRRDLGGYVAASQKDPRWDEFIPQCYRFSYDAFEQTWLDQVKWMKTLGGGRVNHMLPGIRVVGEGKDSTWEDLRKSIELARKTGAGGHVHWFSKGVFLYERELTEFYGRHAGATNPRFPADWRTPVELTDTQTTDADGHGLWKVGALAEGAYELLAFDGESWYRVRQLQATPKHEGALEALPQGTRDAAIVRVRVADNAAFVGLR